MIYGVTRPFCSGYAMSPSRKSGSSDGKSEVVFAVAGRLNSLESKKMVNFLASENSSVTLSSSL